MTLLNTQVTVTYLGDGVTTGFPVPFPFYGQTELLVIQTVIATGAQTTKIFNSDYTVIGGGGAAGTVKASSAPPNTVKWTIKRNTAITQLVDYTPNDPFPAETQELSLDKITAIVQELAETLGRTITIAISSGLIDIQIPLPGAGKFIRWNVAGTALEAVDLASTGMLGLPVSIGDGGTGAINKEDAIDNLDIAGVEVYLWENFR